VNQVGYFHRSSETAIKTHTRTHEHAHTAKYVSNAKYITRQAIYVYRNNEERSYNYCSGKAMRVTYCEYVFVALGIQHAMRMRDIGVCGLPGSTIFLYIIS